MITTDVSLQISLKVQTMRFTIYWNYFIAYGLPKTIPNVFAKEYEKKELCRSIMVLLLSTIGWTRPLTSYAQCSMLIHLKFYTIVGTSTERQRVHLFAKVRSFVDSSEFK